MEKIKGSTPEQIHLIQKILNTHLKKFPGIQIYAFGSRVEGTHRPNSDLDLWIENDQALPLSSLALLKESFENSNLPYKIDLIEAKRVPESILKNILTLKRIRFDLTPC